MSTTPPSPRQPSAQPVKHNPTVTLIEIEYRARKIDKRLADHHAQIESMLREQQLALSEIASGRFFRRRQMTLAGTVAIGVLAALIMFGCIGGALVTALTDLAAQRSMR
jgi:cytochrome c biogenesis protein CcdA